MQLHTKRRNKLEQKRLNNLVYIKYNRALRWRYVARDIIDPITLDDIDECNEWLLERLNLSEEDDDEENARVYEDDDLTWGDVARASGVDEDAYAFHPRHSKVLKSTMLKASSSKATFCIYLLEIHHKASSY
ncbi:UNVERIFIED_CONTAM: hypothetical protein Sradi_3585600 [Sesamum radiatum]|uniref:Uncharacterized protein n=1 Tax=Sesamum radiatum TaxID=300843 RepID=A0AAW2QHB0_SESRA